MTTKANLTETQRQVLERAADHALNEVVWFPDNVKGNARSKVLASLAMKGWITECKGHWFLAAGAASALERDVQPPIPTMPATHPDPEVEAALVATEAQWVAEKGAVDPQSVAVEARPRTRENSKQATVIAMLQRPEGTTIAQICASTGWLAHTVRGCLAGALKKKLGMTITSEKAQGGERVYRAA